MPEMPAPRITTRLPYPEPSGRSSVAACALSGPRRPSVFIV